MALDTGMTRRDISKWKTLAKRAVTFSGKTGHECVLITVVPSKGGGEELLIKGSRGSKIGRAINSLIPEIMTKLEEILTHPPAAEESDPVPDPAAALPQLATPVEKHTFKEKLHLLRSLIEKTEQRSQPRYTRPECRPAWWDTEILPWANIDKDRRRVKPVPFRHALSAMIYAAYRFYGIEDPMSPVRSTVNASSIVQNNEVHEESQSAGNEFNEIEVSMETDEPAPESLVNPTTEPQPVDTDLSAVEHEILQATFTVAEPCLDLPEDEPEALQEAVQASTFNFEPQLNSTAHIPIVVYDGNTEVVLDTVPVSVLKEPAPRPWKPRPWQSRRKASPKKPRRSTSTYSISALEASIDSIINKSLR